MMIQLLFVFLLSLKALYAQTVPTILPVDVSDPVFTLFSDQGVDRSVRLNFNNNSGASASSPIEIFVPVRSVSGGIDNNDYFTGDLDSLPGIQSVNDSSGDIGFSIDVNLNNADANGELFLVVAVETGNAGSGEYTPIFNIDGDSDPSTDPTTSTRAFNGQLSFTLPLETLCSPNLNSNNQCSNIFETQAGGEVELNMIIGLSTSRVDDSGSGGTISADNLQGDLFFQVNLRSRVNSSNVIILERIDRGDRQIFADFTGFAFEGNDSLYAFRVDNGTTTCPAIPNGEVDTFNFGEIVAQLPGGVNSELVTLNNQAAEGSVELRNLQNNICYSVRLAYLDFFQFATRFSREGSATTESIQALLRSQSCFFFTAGFQREHYIVNYFQKFRDSVLMKFALGRLFVSWYYSFAPKYAHYILENDWLARAFRGLGHFLYFSFRYWPVSLSIMLLSFIQLFRFKRVIS